MKLSVVIPVFNEEKTIEKIVEKVLSEETPKEIIIVDDGSFDKTREILKRIKGNNIKVIFHEKNRGKGAAVRTGIKNAKGDVLIIQDADLEYDPNDYQKLLGLIVEKKTKVVYGSRLKKLRFRLWGKNKTPLPLHYLANRFLSFLSNILLGSRLTDMETCYKMMTREVYRSLDLVSDRFEIEPEITAKILRAEYEILEVPIQVKPRSYKQGKKIKAKDAILAVKTLFSFSPRGSSLKTAGIMLTIFLISIKLFSPTFSYFFSQDDFFHLKMSQAGSLSDVLLFFSPQNPFGYYFYRPLTVQTFLFLARSLFGLNPLPFRLIIFLFFLGNIYLVYKLIEKLTSNKTVSLCAAFLYGCSGLHFATLSYISTFVDIGAAFFFFMAILFYLKEKKISLLFFVLSLLSFETALCLPIVIFSIELFGNKNFKKTIPYFFVLFIYFLFRLLLLKFPENQVYNFIPSIRSTLNSTVWYVLWSAGMPENFTDFVGSGFRLTERFSEVFGWKGYATIFGAMFTLLSLAVGSLKLLKSKEDRNFMVIFLVWFLAGLAPFILWPQHKFVYYLEISLLGFCGLLSLSISKLSKFHYFFVILIFLLTSVLTVDFYKKNYWTVSRARVAGNVLNEIKETYSDLPEGSTIYFKNDQNYKYISEEWGGTSSQVKVAISGCNGVQLIYNNWSLKCLFEDDNIEIKEDYYPFIAKVN